MTHRIFSSVLAALLSTMAVAATAVPAAASGPIRQPLVNTPGQLTGLCSFPVDMTFPVNGESSITFFDSAGNPTRTLINGPLVVTLTNADDPSKTLTQNISGPGQIIYNADGSETITFLGNSAVFVQDGILLTRGRVVGLAASPTATTVILTATGLQSNVCDLLA